MHYDYGKSSGHPTPILVQEGPVLFQESHRQKSALTKPKNVDESNLRISNWKQQILTLPKEEQQTLLELLLNKNS